MYHTNRTRWAVSCTVATLHAIYQRNTVLANPHGMTNLGGRLLFFGYFEDCTRWANLATFGAFGTAIATLVGEGGLHQLEHIGRGTQHIIGTHRHA